MAYYANALRIMLSNCITAAKLMGVMMGAGHQSALQQLVGCTLQTVKSIKVELCPPYFLPLNLQLFGAAETREMPMLRLLHL